MGFPIVSGNLMGFGQGMQNANIRGFQKDTISSVQVLPRVTTIECKQMKQGKGFQFRNEGFDFVVVHREEEIKNNYPDYLQEINSAGIGYDS